MGKFNISFKGEKVKKLTVKADSGVTVVIDHVLGKKPIGSIGLTGRTGGTSLINITSLEDIQGLREYFINMPSLDNSEKSVCLEFLEAMHAIETHKLPLTATRGIDQTYNFEKLVINTQEGGRVTITNYGGQADIGYMSSVNPHGLGGSEYIRHKDAVANHIEHVKKTVWLTKHEKRACIDFLKVIYSTAV